MTTNNPFPGCPFLVKQIIKIVRDNFPDGFNYILPLKMLL